MPKYNKPTITIRRSGTFKVPGLVPDRKCGHPDQTIFHFELHIVVTRLDPSGFVCDNFEVPVMLERAFGSRDDLWEGSCEDFAGAGVILAHRMCEGRALEIDFEVSPIAEAGVTVSWEKPQPLPTFYPKKVGEARPSPREFRNQELTYWETSDGVHS